MMFCRAICICLIASLLIPPTMLRAAQDSAMSQGSRSPLLQKVDTSIDRGTKYLLGKQNSDGSFGEPDAGSGRKVGETALVTLALLSCGESHQSPQLTKAL